MNKFNMSRLASSLALALTLIACGGGGGGSTPAPTPAPTPTPSPTPAPAPTPTPDLNSEFGEFLVSLADNVVIPAYRKMGADAQRLDVAGDRFCQLAEPTQTDLGTLRDSWKTFNQSWQSINWVKVGPIVALPEQRNVRLQIWPDSNNAVSRAVEAHLLDPATLTAEYISNKNVGGQGIPALEYLLYPSDTAKSMLNAADRTKRCELFGAVTKNVINITTEVITAWQPDSGNYRANFVAGTGEFTSVKDAIDELATNWLENIELVKDEKMLVPLGSAAPGNVQITEHVLSDESLRSIETNLKAYLALYTGGESKGLDDVLAGQEQTVIRDRLRGHIDKCITQIANIRGLNKSYADLLSSASGRAAIQALIDELRLLRDLMSIEMVQLLDINIGFNANDGD